MITLSQFQKMIPTNKEPDVWYKLAMELFPRYELTTENRIAGFMAQCAHESKDFTVLEENMNYSWRQLRKVFPRYFTTDSFAKLHERKPEQIANIVYDDANRVNKLGNVRPGDGWRFRGGGIKQLTGRSNYQEFAESIGKTAEEAADYVRTKQGAMESALWFWLTNSLNSFADRDDIVGMSRRINGGDIGLADRKRRYALAKQVMSVVKEDTPTPRQPAPVNSNSSRIVELRRGSRGHDVQRIQKALSLTTDGIFGIRTESSVRQWQKLNKYPITGIINTEQFFKLTGQR